MDSITEYIKSSGGYARMKELRAAGFQTREISALVDQGRIERVKPGLYRLAEYGASGEHAGLVEVCRAHSWGDYLSAVCSRFPWTDHLQPFGGPCGHSPCSQTAPDFLSTHQALFLS